MAFYFAVDAGKDIFGDPEPAPGVRVRFVIEKLFAARGKPFPLKGDEGLVVHQDPTGTITWPSQLWLVTDLERPVRVLPGNTRVRCQAFTVEREAPVWLAAGPRGYAVQQVITQAKALTSGQVAALAAISDEGEQELTQLLWKRWSDTHHRSGSPVGGALAAVHQAVDEAARRTSPTLFEWSEDDGGAVLADPAWIRAGQAANRAALGYGAAGLLADEQHSVLTRRWMTVFGPPKPETVSHR